MLATLVKTLYYILKREFFIIPTQTFHSLSFHYPTLKKGQYFNSKISVIQSHYISSAPDSLLEGSMVSKSWVGNWEKRT